MRDLIVPKLEARASAERVADTLRERITSGDLPPGTALREESTAASLKVSRNTLRESIRLLVAEGLLVQKLHKGATVRTITIEEVQDIYVVRRTIELRAIDQSGLADAPRFAALQLAVRASQTAVADKAWKDVGTASLRFHQAIVGLLGSKKLDDFFATVAAQLRLAFSMAEDQARFQKGWIEREIEICDLIMTGRRTEAVDAMTLYLADAERYVIDIVRARLHTFIGRGQQYGGEITQIIARRP
jgi:DNA-binding GntR family transcriptional regulator